MGSVDDPRLEHRQRLSAVLAACIEVQRGFDERPRWAFTGAEDLALAFGRWFDPSLLPPARPRGTEGRCYANATRYAATYSLTYVEGFGLTTAGMPLAHAWCVDDHGIVHDPTWPDEAVLAYLGVPFSPEYIHEADATSGGACLLHDAHRDDHRILRDGFPPGAVVEIGVPVAPTRQRERPPVVHGSGRGAGVQRDD